MEVPESQEVRGVVTAAVSTALSQLSSSRDRGVSSDRRATPTGESGREMSASVAAQVAQALNEFASAVNVRIAFQVDQATGKTVIKVIDQETKEVIRQVPPEEVLRLVARMNHVLGLLLNGQA